MKTFTLYLKKYLHTICFILSTAISRSSGRMKRSFSNKQTLFLPSLNTFWTGTSFTTSWFSIVLMTRVRPPTVFQVLEEDKSTSPLTSWVATTSLWKIGSSRRGSSKKLNSRLYWEYSTFAPFCRNALLPNLVSHSEYCETLVSLFIVFLCKLCV